ncbi:MAG TPA: hypothetical protein ENN50_02625 [Prosthecochloris aestuarii]|uniref:TonB C-terminal domain-containing protein n=1 Tax=Prosthecochloris aestuarii TaxID=1102 RepID=A0A831SRF2_PROAE|nr:hypothetical protein [Prosthecochloris aestuarii]
MKSDEYLKERGRFTVAMLIAFALHLVVALVLVYLQSVRPQEPEVVTVSLVSLPGPDEGSPEAGGSLSPPAVIEEPEIVEPVPEVIEPEPEPVKESVPVKTPEPEPAPDAVALEPAEKKTVEKPVPQNRIEDALSDLAGKVDRDQPTDLERALARLQQKVQQEGPPSSLYERSGPGTGPGGGGGMVSPYQEYLSQVVLIITRSWSFSGELLRNQQGIEAYVAITIMPDGEIRDVTFDRHSSSPYFDETVTKALQAASPLPPVPVEVSVSPMRLGLIFSPRGVR